MIETKGSQIYRDNIFGFEEMRVVNLVLLGNGKRTKGMANTVYLSFFFNLANTMQ